MEKTIEQIKKEALKELEAAFDSESIKALSVRYLGRKGAVTQYLRNISNLPEESRPEAGKKANQTKQILDELFKNALKRLETPSYETDNWIDVSLPGRRNPANDTTRNSPRALRRPGYPGSRQDQIANALASAVTCV